MSVFSGVDLSHEQRLEPAVLTQNCEAPVVKHKVQKLQPAPCLRHDKEIKHKTATTEKSVIVCIVVKAIWLLSAMLSCFSNCTWSDGNTYLGLIL